LPWGKRSTGRRPTPSNISKERQTECNELLPWGTMLTQGTFPLRRLSHIALGRSELNLVNFLPME